MGCNIIIHKVNEEQYKFVEELEEEYDMTLSELEGYYEEARRLKLTKAVKGMKLVKEWEEDSAYSFLDGKSDKYIEKEIEKYSCDHDLIETHLNKKYPEDKYFILIDFNEDNNGSFHIRVWRK